MNAAKTRQQERIEAHGRALLAIFPDALQQDPAKLCKRLRRLEASAHEIGLRLCNGPEFPEGEVDRATDRVLAQVNKLLGNKNCKVPVRLNRDPRGYALKISDQWMMKTGAALHRDWGGYGILAPEINGER